MQFLNALSDAQLEFLLNYWPFWARPDQLPPAGKWRIWLLLGGRGAGKTRAGAEWIRAQVEGATPLAGGTCRHLALVGETLLAVREVMIEGPSGLCAISTDDYRPDYIASRQILVWPNGAQAQIFSAHQPEKLRGPQFDAAWCDEIGKWRNAVNCWDMLQFGLRLGQQPRQVVTTTPRATKLIKQLLEDPGCHVTRASTIANRAHLAPGFVEELLRRYEGTRLGRQEIDAEMVEDVAGALWTLDMIAANRIRKAPSLVSVIVAVDPPSITHPKADACGICVVGRDNRDHGYVLADETVRGLSPAGWARKIVQVYRHYQADRLVAEVNQGGDLIREIVLREAPDLNYRAVRATRGKMLRAEPIAALYERGHIHHVGVHKQLEQELCRYDGKGKASPDRLDALVWGLTELMFHHRQNEPILRQL